MLIVLPYNLLGSDAPFATPSHYPPIEGTYSSYLILHGAPLISLINGPESSYASLHGTPSHYSPLEGPPTAYPIIRG